MRTPAYPFADTPDRTPDHSHIAKSRSRRPNPVSTVPARRMLSAQAMPGGCATTATYQARQPAHTVLYRTVEAHLETFLAHTAGDAERSGLPGFVKREFEAYLRCGILAHGFARSAVMAARSSTWCPSRAKAGDMRSGGICGVEGLPTHFPQVETAISAPTAWLGSRIQEGVRGDTEEGEEPAL